MNGKSDDVQLSQLADGELDSDQANAVLLEVLHDAEARERLRGLLQLRQSLAGWRRQQPAATAAALKAGWGRRPSHRSAWLIAACVALAVTGWAMYLQNTMLTGRRPSQEARVLVVAGPTPEQVAEHVRVFDQVCSVFDRRASWVLVGDQTSDMGLGRNPVTARTGLLVARLTLAEGSSVVSSADLVIVPGESAYLTLPTQRGLRVCYRVATSEKTPTHMQVAVDIGRAGRAQEAWATLAADLRLEPGHMLRVGEVATPSGYYVLNVGLYPTERVVQRS